MSVPTWLLVALLTYKAKAIPNPNVNAIPNLTLTL